MEASSSKKREAEYQLTRDDVNKEEKELNMGCDQPETGGPSPDTQTLADRRVIKVDALKSDINQNSNDTQSFTLKPSTISSIEAPSGFLAYSKLNPFAAAASTSTSTLPQSSPMRSNPFSSPSPAHNPFMSFLEKKEEFWNNLSKKCTPEETSGSAFGFAFRTTPTSPSPLAAAPATLPDTLTKPPVPDSEGVSVVIGGGSSLLGAVNSGLSGKEKSDDKDEETEECNANTKREIDEDDNTTDNIVSQHAAWLQSESSLVNGEEGEQCELQVRTKLYRLATGSSKSQTSPSSAPQTTAGIPQESSISIFSSSSNISKVLISSNADGDITDKDESSVATETVGLNSTPCTSSSITSSSTIGVSAAGREAVDKHPEWVEMGTGPVRVLIPIAKSVSKTASHRTGETETETKTETSTLDIKDKNEEQNGETNDKYKTDIPRIVMRRENQPGGCGTKLLLNVLLRKDFVTVAKQGEKAVRFTCIDVEDSGKVKPVSYLMRTKHIQESDRLVETVNALLGSSTES